MHDHLHHHHEEIDGPGESLDTANKALADALRSSFFVLKVIMVAIGALYIVSGVGYLEQNEEALVLRLGVLKPGTLKSGAYWVWPRPFEELVVVPVAQNRTTTILSQQMMLPERNGKVLSFEEAPDPGPKLDPAKHFSIMTGDRELVHSEWVVNYTIENLGKFISNVYLAKEQSEEDLIRIAIENAAVKVIGQQTAVDVVRNKISDIQLGVKIAAQETLDALDSGIRLATINPKPYWPKNTKSTFDAVTNASNERRKLVDEANQDSIERLNSTAGVAHEKLKGHLDGYLAAKAVNNEELASVSMREMEKVIIQQATGMAGERIRQAESYRRRVLEGIKADYNQYVSYLEEYKTNPRLLFARLWNKAQSEIRTNPNVIVNLLPAGQKEVRLQIGPDPEEKRARETRRDDKKKAGDFSTVKHPRSTPVIEKGRGRM